MVWFDEKVPSELNGYQSNKTLKFASDDKNQPEREVWGNKAEFLLSCIGLSVGIGNVWRFPYLAYQNGGAAFLVAYVVLLLVVGKPYFFAELAIGQFTGAGSIQVWRCLPIAKGVGISMVVVSLMISIYYNVIMMYTLYYIGQSFRSEVPWKECREWWGADEQCYVRESNHTHCRDVAENLALKYMTNNESTEHLMESYSNLTWENNIISIPSDELLSAYKTCSNGTETASEQFWEHYVLQLTSGINELGTVKWDLALTLFVCWAIVYFGLMKGIKSSGKVVYFTATFPYVILITLMVYGCTLPGAVEGLKYLFIPEWRKLLEIQVWRAATEQLLFSLGLGSGTLIMYASYNKFDNKLYRDAMIVSSLDFATSLIAGIVIFSFLGHMATEIKLDITVVAKGGQGLAFVTYPEALAKLPISQLWSVLFFFMLFLLAVDSEFSYLENFYTTLYDEHPHLKRKKVLINLVTCFIFFLCGLPCVTQGGQYVLNLMDTYAGGYASIFIATFELTAFMWGYGAERFSNDIDFMLGFRPATYWRMCWKYISPVVLWFVLIYSLFTHTPIQYGGEDYPLWAERLGWFLVMISVLQVPIWAMIQIIRYRENWRMLFKPDPDWGPQNPETRHIYQMSLLTSKSKRESAADGIENLGMDTMSEGDR